MANFIHVQPIQLPQYPWYSHLHLTIHIHITCFSALKSIPHESKLLYIYIIYTYTERSIKNNQRLLSSYTTSEM